MTGKTPVNGLLGRAVNPSKESGSLNPMWVEWLMGFPAGWTDLEHSEMPSSPNKSCPYSKQSHVSKEEIRKNHQGGEKIE